MSALRCSACRCSASQLLGAQPLGFDHVVLEHLDRAGHFADLVASAEARDRALDVATGKPRHGGHHRGQRLGDRPADQERKSEYQDDRRPERDQHPFPHRSARGRLTCFGRREQPLDALLDLGDHGLDFLKRLRHCCAIAGDFQRAGGPGRKIRLVLFQLPGDVSLDGRFDAGARQRLREIRCGLFQFGDILRVAPQHEILLVPPQHQHRAGQSRIVDFLEFGLDVVNGCAQRTGQAQFFIQSKLDLGLREACKDLHIVCEAALYDVDLLDNGVDAAGSRQGFQFLRDRGRFRQIIRNDA